MQMKKLICTFMASVMLISATAFGAGAAPAPEEDISPEEISVTWEDSRVYKDLSLGRCRTIATYGVEGYEDVPFVMVSDYLDILLEGKQKIETGDVVMRVSVNGTEAVIDPFRDTIRFEDPARFRSFGDVGGAVVEDGEFNVITSYSLEDYTKLFSSHVYYIWNNLIFLL